MDKELLLIAAKACLEAYDPEKRVDLGHAEYALTIKEHSILGPIQVLAIPGSDEKLDWLLNVIVASWGGVKVAARNAARKIRGEAWQWILGNNIEYNMTRDIDLKLLVVGHSKGGPTALRWKDVYNADYCVAICPPPAFRRWSKPKLDNTVIITDPDDIVHKLGMISFTQPEVTEVIELPNDKRGIDLKDHLLPNVISFLEGM